MTGESGMDELGWAGTTTGTLDPYSLPCLAKNVNCLVSEYPPFQFYKTRMMYDAWPGLSGLMLIFYFI